MRNAAAHAALRRFCQDALVHIGRAVVEPGDIPTTKAISSAEFLSERELSWKVVTEVDWVQVSRNHLGEPESIPSWGEALAAVKADGRLAGRDVAWEEPAITIVELLLRLVREQGGLEFEEDSFDKVYQETEDYFYQDTAQYRYLAPLRPFRMETEEVPLDPGLSIVRVHLEWTREMLLESADRSPIGAQLVDLAGLRHAMVLYLELQKEADTDRLFRCPGGHEPAIETARGTFREVCTALRLFKPGAVGYDWIVPRPTSWVPTSSRTLAAGGARASVGEPYELSAEEAAEFPHFWTAYSASKAVMADSVSVAVQRFNMAYARGSAEERLVDLMVGFEALLLGNEQELRYKLAMRGAALLGSDADERETVRDELEAAYSQRNHIVHGGKAKERVKVRNEAGVSLADLNGRVEGRLRAGIRKVIEMEPPVSKRALMRQLDLQIARGFESP